MIRWIEDLDELGGGGTELAVVWRVHLHSPAAIRALATCPAKPADLADAALLRNPDASARRLHRRRLLRALIARATGAPVDRVALTRAENGAQSLDGAGTRPRPVIPRSPCHPGSRAAAGRDPDTQSSPDGSARLGPALAALHASMRDETRGTHVTLLRPEETAELVHDLSVAARGDWALLAVASGPIGVDLECADGPPPPDASWEAWTAREAYAKATGISLDAAQQLPAEQIRAEHCRFGDIVCAACFAPPCAAAAARA